MLVEIFSRDYSCLPAVLHLTLAMERRALSHWPRSLVCVYGFSLAGIPGSSSARGMKVCLL
jgi:hypothetical protein